MRFIYLVGVLHILNGLPIIYSFIVLFNVNCMIKICYLGAFGTLFLLIHPLSLSFCVQAKADPLVVDSVKSQLFSLIYKWYSYTKAKKRPKKEKKGAVKKVTLIATESSSPKTHLFS